MFFAVILKVNLSLPSFYIAFLVYRAPIWELNSKLVLHDSILHALLYFFLYSLKCRLIGCDCVSRSLSSALFCLA